MLQRPDDTLLRDGRDAILMQTLLLMRHAKSDWEDATVPDHERPLAERGRGAAPAMAQWMRSQELRPDLVLCSTAKRTRETWDLLEGELCSSAEVLFLEELYLASPRDMLGLIREHGGTAETVLMIGHNPGTHELACALAASGPDKLLRRMDQKYPTGALAHYRIDTLDWRTLGQRGSALVDFIRPKDLKDPRRAGS